MSSDDEKITSVTLSYHTVRSGAPDLEGAAALLKQHGYSWSAHLLEEVARQNKRLVNPLRSGAPIRHTLIVQAPVRGGERLTVDEARKQWQEAMRLAEGAERIYNQQIARESDGQ